jgi:hypothetical protein
VGCGVAIEVPLAGEPAPTREYGQGYDLAFGEGGIGTGSPSWWLGVAKVVDHNVKCGEEGVHIDHEESVPFPSGSGSKPTLVCGHLPFKPSIDNSHQAFNDVYRPYNSEDLERLVEDGNLSPDVYATLDPERTYGVQWYNRHKTETVPGPGGRDKKIQTDRPRREWVAVPVPDAGIPLVWVEEARKCIENNVRHSDAGRRAWLLKGFAYCPCGSRLVPFTLVERSKGKLRYYYVCRWHRARKGGCEYAKYYRAEEIEGRVSAFVLNLIRNRDTLREQVEAEAAREKATMRDTRKRVAALAHHLAEVDSERDRLVRLYTRGKLTDDEYDTYTAEIAERKKAAEDELSRLEDAKRYVEYLDSMPQLVEDYLKELPQIIDDRPPIREYVIKDEHKNKGLTPRSVVSGSHRKRTPEEMEQLRQEAERERAERYRRAYDMLNLKVVAYPDGTLEISWTGGFCKLQDTPTSVPGRRAGPTSLPAKR